MPHRVTEWNDKDWCAAAPGAHNATVTITYPNRSVLKATVLSHEEHEIRAIATGCDDVLTFTRVHGTWISEEIEPVTIEFEWQRRGAPHATSEDDCVCPKNVAAHLIQRLLGGSERYEVSANTFHAFSAERTAALHRAELQPR